MGQKINPISLRLASTNRNFDDCWYSDYFYSYLFCHQLKIRLYINSILKQIKYPTARLYIQIFQKKAKIFLFFYDPKNSRKIRFKLFNLKKYNIIKKRRQRRHKFKKKKNLFKARNRKNLKKINASNLYKKKIFKHIYAQKSGNQISKEVFIRYFLLQNFLLRNINKISFLIPQKNSLLKVNNFPLVDPIRGYSLINTFLCSSLLKKKLYLLRRKKIYKKILRRKNIKYLFKYLHRPKFTNKSKNLSAKSSRFQALENLLSYLKYTKGKVWHQTRNARGFLISNGRIFLNYDQFKHLALHHKITTLKVANTLPRDKNIYIPSSDADEVPSLKKRIKEIQSISKKKSILKYILGVYFFHPYFIAEKNPKKRLKKKKTKKIFKNHLEYSLCKGVGLDINLYPIKISNNFASALFLAEEIVYYLQRKVPLRRITNRILRDSKRNDQVQGIRIVCSGRIGGRSKKAQRAKTVTIKSGRTPLHIFSSFIDFASKTAATRFGSLGLKVWICYS